jgi:hypothetical protein
VQKSTGVWLLGDRLLHKAVTVGRHGRKTIKYESMEIQIIEIVIVIKLFHYFSTLYFKGNLGEGQALSLV